MSYKTPDETLDEPADITLRELTRMLRRCCGLDQYLSVGEAAAYVRVRRQTIYDWIKAGRLGGYTPSPGKIIVRKRDLEDLVRASRYDPEAPTFRRGFAAAPAPAAL